MKSRANQKLQQTACSIAFGSAFKMMFDNTDLKASGEFVSRAKSPGSKGALPWIQSSELGPKAFFQASMGILVCRAGQSHGPLASMT